MDCDAPPDASDQAQTADLDALATALRPADADETQHFAIEEMGELVRQRQSQGSDWRMPEHLASCPPCLEVFGVLLGGTPGVSAQAAERYHAMFRTAGAPAVAGAIRPRRLWSVVAGVAAAVLVIAVWVGHKRAYRPVPAVVSTGALVIADWPNVASGSVSVPRGQSLMTPQPATVVLKDGSQFQTDSGTEFVIRPSLAEGIKVHLRRGTLVASVTKQPDGRHFIVHTALGEVQVVGTQFSVRYADEPVTIYRSEQEGTSTSVQRYEDRIKTVIVAVTEGVVLVRNRHEQARVSAGRRATLRQDQTHIDLWEDQP